MIISASFADIVHELRIGSDGVFVGKTVVEAPVTILASIYQVIGIDIVGAGFTVFYNSIRTIEDDIVCDEAIVIPGRIAIVIIAAADNNARPVSAVENGIVHEVDVMRVMPGMKATILDAIDKVVIYVAICGYIYALNMAARRRSDMVDDVADNVVVFTAIISIRTDTGATVIGCRDLCRDVMNMIVSDHGVGAAYIDTVKPAGTAIGTVNVKSNDVNIISSVIPQNTL